MPIRPKARMTADHRVISRILELSFGDKNPSEEKLNLCSKVFENAGGSWYSFFKGEVDQVKLLKRAVKVVVLKEQIDKKRS